jgi:Rrf2 family protein
MLISTRGRYALRVMVDLAEHNRGDFIPLDDIAKRQEISKKYLERILPSLVEGGLIEGARGKGGGYRLRCNPDSCTAAEVLTLAEGSLVPVACLGKNPNPCHRAAFCKTLPMWREFAQQTELFFKNITISDLAGNSNFIFSHLRHHP